MTGKTTSKFGEQLKLDNGEEVFYTSWARILQ